jgi:flagellar hook-associated protein 3 FlgL
MNLRVSLQSQVGQALFYERQQTAAMSHLQQEESSGNRILSPDDDPLGAVAVINYNTQTAGDTTDLTNIDTATNTLNGSVSTLQSVGGVLNQARQLAIQAANSGNDASALGALGRQADALLNQLVGLANTQNNGQYLYGGTKTDAAPFVVDAAGNVTYVGGSQRAGVPIGTARSVDTNYTGSEVFQPPSNGVSIYVGKTGAQPGTGIDTATGTGTLLVSHTATTYAGNSGVAPGTDSATGDTIIGPAGANTLQFNGNGTVSLNGGPAVSYSGTDTDLKLTGPNGEVAYIDTTSVAANYQGTVQATATGALSVGGGPAVAINFSSNQVVTGPDGTVTNVDSTNIRQAGTDTITYAGSLNAFQVLQGLRDDLLNTRNLNSAAQLRSISNRLGELSQVSDNVNRVVGQQSASLQNLSGLQTQIQNAQLETQKLTGDVQSADIASVVTNLQAQQTLFQATLEVTSQLFSQSLLNFIK